MNIGILDMYFSPYDTFLREFFIPILNIKFTY